VLSPLIKNALSGTAEPAGKRRRSSKKLEPTLSSPNGCSVQLTVSSSTPSKTPRAGVDYDYWLGSAHVFR
jgi:hypothetical protein